MPPNTRVEPTALSGRSAGRSLPATVVISQWTLPESGGGSRASRWADNYHPRLV